MISPSALSERSARAWRRFRSWPAWAQTLCWVVGWIVVVPIWAWASKLGTRSKIAVSATALTLFIASAAAAATAPSSSPIRAVVPTSLAPEASTRILTPSTTGSLTSPASPTRVSKVRVPNLVGQSFKSASSTLDALELSAKRKDRIDDSVKAGTVLAQSVKASKRIAVGSSIVLTVAKQSSTPGAVDCPGNALMGVYHPYRLHVLATCQWYMGTVVAVRPEDDGDHHIDVAPDPGYSKFLNDGDRAHQQDGLLIEVMKGQQLPIPFEGEHISVFGTWVYDADHGWNEIHAIWAIKYLDTGKVVMALPPATPEYEPGSGGSGGPGGGGGSGGGGGGGGDCDPSYVGVCLHDGIGDYDCKGGSGNGPNYVEGPFQVVGADPFGLDADHDGVGCD